MIRKMKTSDNFEKASKKITQKIKLIFSNPIFLAGIVIRILFLWYTLSLQRDLNDMNEVLTYAIQRLFSGENPYEFGYEYTLTILDNTYEYHFGYPPVVVFAYIPVMLYSDMWGVWDFNIIMFSMNVFFDFLCVYLFTKKGNSFANYTIAIYWAVPIFSYADYVTFFSLMYLFIFLTFVYKDDPLKSSLFMFLGIGSYHLLILMVPSLLIYYIRNYKPLEESVLEYKQEFEAHEKDKFTVKENITKAMDMENVKRMFKRGIADLKHNFSTVLKKVLIGFLPTLFMFLPFIFWDFWGLKYHLIDASANRYDLGSKSLILFLLMLVLLLVVVFSAVVQFLISKKHIADCWLLTSQLLIFFFESLYLVVSTNGYPHYFALLIPFGFYLIMLVWYDFRAYRVLRNEKIPGIKNEKFALIHEKYFANSGD